MREQVLLHVYDLSQGLARQWSTLLLGTQLEGIWHTGIVVYSKEFFYGGGICIDSPGHTPYGSPTKIVDLGETSKTFEEFQSFLSTIRDKYSFESYDLLENNCNNFTSECALFLLNKNIPEDILHLPSIALGTPLGQLLRPVIANLQQQFRQNFGSSSILTSKDSSSSINFQHTPEIGRPNHTESISDNKSLEDCLSSEYRCPYLFEHFDEEKVVGKLYELNPVAKNLSRQGLLELSLKGDSSTLFPLLDKLRFDILRDRSLANEISQNYLSDILQKHCSSTSPWSTTLMSLRLLANIFRYDDIITEFFTQASHQEVVVKSLCHSFVHPKPSVVETGCAAFSNFCRWLYFSRIELSEEILFQLGHNFFSFITRDTCDNYGNQQRIHILLSIAALCIYNESLLELARAMELSSSSVLRSNNLPVKASMISNKLVEFLK
ncbi:hypothetical protein GpartN1_g3441.t1 [Galdieria partita]|uniref:PPPDE domain-containing protein n=1 Tax=Galdieria partita TaxID=83374 RepID=A0A9C7UQJ0_9RHOD|nr:hypothetical protein GpartN1_g3441.t1 [Galdieria partita]